MKKLLSSVIITCILLMSFCNVSYAATFQPVIVAEDGSVGDTVTVTVSIPANTNAAGGSFNLIYDNEKTELIDAVAGDLISGFSKTVNQTYAENKIRVNFAGSEVVSASGGVVLTSTFKLKSEGTATFTVEKFKLADIDTNYLECTGVSESISITNATVESTFVPVITAMGGEVDDTVTVMVSIPKNTNAAGGSFNLIYDNTKVELVAADAGEIISAFSKTVNPTYADNKVRLNFAGSETVSANGGVILTATFKLISAGVATFSTEKFKLADIDTNYLTCGNASESVTITEFVKPVAVTGVTLDKTTVVLAEGETETLTATVSPENATNKAVTWTSSNEGVATVADGVVTAKAAGTATITVTTADGSKTATCAITVKAATVSVTGVTLDKTSVTLTKGDTETLTATVAPENATNKAVTWTSSDENVAMVADGVVTAKAAGTATITVTTADGSKTATCAITVKAATVSVTGVTLDKTSVTLTKGDTETLTATVAPENATNKAVTWTSSDENVATVADGIVTAKAAGTATITVTTADGRKTATCVITVDEEPIDENVPTVYASNIKGKAGEQVKVELYVKNNPGILGMMLQLSYDSDLTLTSLEQSIDEDNSALVSLDFTPGNNLESNPINIAWDGLDADATNGKILNAYFTIPEGVENGIIYDINLSYVKGDVYDNDYNDIELTVTNGSITVKNYTIGDVNDDEVINMKDVTMLRRYVVGGYNVTLNEDAADVNCDGIINMKDVTMLRRYVVGGYGVVLG